MPSHFRWLLTCIDDGDNYELRKDPIGFDECTFRLERHAVYKGIFNQFTSNLKFHSDGGGKPFIDEKYVLFDINARVNIDVLIDRDGLGQTYDTLFSGRLNLASYQNDGIHTIVNIEQSEIATKLNTRADIPVPVNVPVIKVPGQDPFKAVFMDSYVSGDHGDVTSGTFIFEDPQILKGKIFKILTTDSGNNLVADSVTFTTDHDAGPGGSSGGTSLQITDVVDGALTVTFVAINSDIILYQVGPQLSLGQQVITPVKTLQITLPGIPLLYQSENKMKGDINSGTSQTATPPRFNDAGIAAGHTITIYGTDINLNQISDEVLFTGANIPGPGSTQNGSSIQITSITPGSVDITYRNIYGDIELWIDGTFISSFTPVSTSASQAFDLALVSPVIGTENCEGFLNFDTDTVFDNFNEIVFGAFTEAPYYIGASPINFGNTNLPPIFEAVATPAIKYPISIAVKIKMLGQLLNIYTNGGTNEMDRHFLGNFGFAHGKDLASATKVNLQNFPNAYYPNATTITLDINVDYADTITLQPGDKIWFYFYFLNNFNSADTGTLTFGLTFNFTSSLLDFQIVENALPTTGPAVHIHEAFNQVVDMMADSDGNFYSEFYGRTDSAKRIYLANGEGAQRVLTNGLCIRGKQDKYISASLNDLFASMSAIDNLGMEIDTLNRLRIEKLEHFFDKDTRIITLPKVYSFTTLNENSLYYNQIAIGYDKWETEIYFKNGLDEIHGKRYFGTRVATAKGTVLQKYGSEVKSLLAVSNKLDRTCKLVAGNYAIELTRRKNFEWSTDDFKYDNDNFLLCTTNKYYGFITINNSTELLFPNTITLDWDVVVFYPIPGETITVTGTAHNDGSYVIASIEQITLSKVMIMHLSVTITNTEHIRANVEFSQSRFIQLASYLLDPIGGDIIANVVRPDLSTGWLNMAITPARMLQNNFNHISAGLQKIKGNVQFLNGEGNFLAITKFKDDGATRQQDYNFFNLGENTSLSFGDGNIRNADPLWLPEIYRFEYPLTYKQFKTIRANPNGYIEFYKFAGQTKKGFILSMEYNLKTGMTKFELLKVFDPIIELQESEDARAVADEENIIIETQELRQ